MGLTEKQIYDLAQSLDMGMDLYIHKRTGEVVEIPKEYGHYYLEYNHEFDKELERIESERDDIIKLEPPDSTESFSIMESFVYGLPDSPLRRQLENALERRKPFRNFKDEVHGSALQDQWFQHKQNQLEERVKRMTDQYELPPLFKKNLF